MEKIKSQVKEWAKDHLGKSFEFRENQLETISEIVYGKINGEVPHHIIQAPTGSGKSLINIISAGVLWTYYNKKSYILASDLYLYQQYVDFIDQNNLEDFKYLKGQTGNYHCAKQRLDMRNSACKMAGVSYRNLFYILEHPQKSYGDKKLDKIAKNFPCIRNCQYLIERLEAVEAPITLMTYHLFHFQMNVCDLKVDTHNNPIPGQFQYREYIFCDECHNIPNILRLTCQPTIKYEDLTRLKKIFNYYKSLKKDPSKLKIFQQVNEQELEENFKNIWSQMLDKSLDSYNNTCLLMKYYSKIITKINYIGNRLGGIFGTKLLNGKDLSEIEKTIQQEISWLQNYTCYIGDFCSAIKLTGYHHTYKQILPGNSVKIGTVKEDGIIYSFLLRWAKEGTTLCSATLGNIQSFIENCGYKHFINNEVKIGNFYWKPSGKLKFINMPSNFDFSKSPIYLDYTNKMTFKNKKTSIIPISEKINGILELHNNSNGIIQFDNAIDFFTYGYN